jgi:lipopolysaccharide export system permease protein
VRILDRQRYWSFIKAYVICYVSLVGLYVVIDAFSNLDEFTKRTDGIVELSQIMGRYYLVHQSLFFDQLCGVIGMMAAIFTVTWMQRNNEQLAMLAAGISTQRAIRPVMISSVLVSFFAIGNQEMIMPRFADELSKSHDDDGERTVKVSTRYDGQGLMIRGESADRAAKTIVPFHSTIPVSVFGSIRFLKGPQGTYISPDHPTAPFKGGWLVRDAVISPALDELDLESGRDVLRVVDDLTGFPPAFVPSSKPDAQPMVAALAAATAATTVPPVRPYSEVPVLASLPPFPSIATPALLRVNAMLDRKMDFSRANYFISSGVTFQSVTRKTSWYQFARTADLIEGLTDPSTEGKSERNSMAIFVHLRILRPFLGLALLFMSLPLVLGGYGRNMFINLGFALGNSALFYGALILCSYLAEFHLLTPAQAAWAPLFVFGTIASIRWGQIRT